MDEHRDSPRLILGSGRSGTTWVLDCIANANGLRPVFEPLHPAESSLGMRYAYQLLLPGDEDETLELYFRELAAGHVRSRWIDYRGRRDRLFPNPSQLMSVRAFKGWARRWRKYIRDRKVLRSSAQRNGVLIKCIRANLMAGWLTQTIGFRTILIVRHPGAVIESQYRLGAVWDPTPVLEQYRRGLRLHEVTGGRYMGLINAKLTRLQALALNWIIENQWPVERSRVDGFAVIYYEDLVSRPDGAWRYLSGCLGLTELPELEVLRRPSQQSSIGSTVSVEPKGPAPRWRSRLTQDQRDEIQRVLDATECDLYSLDIDQPLRSNLNHVSFNNEGQDQSGPAIGTF